MADPASPLVFGEALHEAATNAQDVLLVCFVGHGLLDADGELYLATGATDHVRDRLEFTAVPYAVLRKELDRSPARQRIVVLDCCFSGQAGGLATLHWPDGLVTSRAPGGYVLASAAPEESALSPPDQPHTMFTGELIRLLREGDPTGPPALTLDHLYRCLDRALTSRRGPRPRRYVTGQAGDLVLASNPAYRPPRSPPPPSVRSDGVCPYRGLAAYDVVDADYFLVAKPSPSFS
nr:caspase family protein [Pseudonocardia acaciae]